MTVRIRDKLALSQWIAVLADRNRRKMTV